MDSFLTKAKSTKTDSKKVQYLKLVINNPHKRKAETYMASLGVNHTNPLNSKCQFFTKSSKYTEEAGQFPTHFMKQKLITKSGWRKENCKMEKKTIHFQEKLKINTPCKYRSKTLNKILANQLCTQWLSCVQLSHPMVSPRN